MSSEAKRYYEEAKVTPDNIIAELFRRMKETDDDRMASAIGEILFRHHPDMEPNDLVEIKSQRGVNKGIRAWIGDATLIQDQKPKAELAAAKIEAKAMVEAAATSTDDPEDEPEEEGESDG